MASLASDGIHLTVAAAKRAVATTNELFITPSVSGLRSIDTNDGIPKTKARDDEPRALYFAYGD